MIDVAMPKAIDPTPPAVPVHLIQRTIDRTLRTVRARFGQFLISKLPPFSIYLHDCNQVLVIDPASVCRVLAGTEQEIATARYVMCSQVAWYAFAYTWGWGALEVSGMYLDRDYKVSNRLAFYLNLLATECARFDSPHQAVRTLEFLWAKREELRCRIWQSRSHELKTNAQAGVQMLPIGPAQRGRGQEEPGCRARP